MMLNKKIIGVTGGSGSGKSTFCRYLRKRGYATVDADKIGHRIILSGNPAYLEIIEHFGKRILNEEGEIDRRILGKIVFGDPAELKILDGITHKYILLEIEEEIKKAETDIVFIDAAVLPNTPLHKLCDKVVVLIAPIEQRADRIALRDAITAKAAMKRIDAQLSDEEYRACADFVIYNDGSVETLLAGLEQVLKEVSG